MTTQLDQRNKADNARSEELQRLRELVLGDEYYDAIQHFVEKGFSQNVANVLSEAIRLRNQQDSTVGDALAPVVDVALRESVRRNPKSIVDAIFPIIGSSIRKAVSSAVLDLLLSINELIERSVGVRSIVWRFKAWRIGTPYSQYVLLKSLKYRVDQVFLIEKSTGILMASACNQFYQDEDSDLVSSMLTAINDFVVDSFNASDSESLERIRFGDRVIQINVGHNVILAQAITGMVSRHVKLHALEVMEQLEFDHAETIAQFNGDKDSVLMLLPALESCLIEKKQEKDRQEKQPWITYGVLLAILFWFGQSWYFDWQQQRTLNKMASLIQRQEDTVLLEKGIRNEQIFFKLLRDPSATAIQTDLEAIAGEEYTVKLDVTHANLRQSEVWLSYINNHFTLDTKPEIDTSKQELVLKGKIEVEELKRLIEDVPLTGFFKVIDSSAVEVIRPLTDAQRRMNQIKVLKQKINNTRLYFEPASNQLSEVEAAKLVLLVREIGELESLAAGNKSIFGQVLVLGFADGSGTENVNINISQERAELVAQFLRDNAIAEEIIAVHAMGHVDVEGFDMAKQRRVSISVLGDDLDDKGPMN